MLDRAGYNGSINVGCDKATDISVGKHSVKFSVNADSKCELTFVIVLSDSIDTLAPSDFTNELLKMTLSDGYDATKAYHGKVWSDYYEEGYAQTGDDLLDKVYLVAQYHQKCFTTKWSLPVGLNDATWHGRCFGFDEFYMQCGLLTSNHMEAASRAPKFRRKGLPIALQRASHPAELTSARYPWETLEDGTEAAPPGFFYDHIFHMAAIPLSGWEYYCYTKDVDFLCDTVYPVLEACTGFFRLNSLYRVEGGKLIIGKCTDLERLGAHRENAYMTTCGVIATFRAFTEASRILNVNLDIADECEKYAIELKAGLPNNGERYIPYPGCSERSISAFSGTHPFDVIERDDPLQIKAMEDFVEYEDSVGNMYTMGSGVCSWYACWKGVAYSRLGKAKEALATLRYVANTTGDFGEVFEINNAPSKTYIHPWFTTAAGMYVHAFNEALIQSTMTGEIYLLKGIDETFKNVRFKLSARGGLIVFFEMKNGKIEKLDVVGNKFCTFKQVKIILPHHLGGERIVEVLCQ